MPEPERPRFNPFLNEGDMFKVLIAVAVGLAIFAGVVFLLRAIF